MSSTYSFDITFVKRLVVISKVMINETTVVVMTYLLVICMIYETISYNVGMITGAYYKALADKDWNQFWSQTLKALVLIISIALVKSCKDYIVSTVYIEWRKSLTTKLNVLYFKDLSYYRLNVIDRYKDNLDQRITQDVDAFCRSLSSIISDLLVWPFIIPFYTYHSYVIIGYIGPLGCFIFFIVTTVLNKSLISMVSNKVYLQQQSEGNYRFQHIHVRNNCESIALQSGHTFENFKTQQLFNQLVSVQESLIVRELFLKSWVYLSDYLGSIISFIILSFPLFSGKYDNYLAADLSQLISQNAFVTIYLINCYSRLIDTATQLTTIGGTAHRIGEVLEILNSNEDNRQSSSDLNTCINLLGLCESNNYCNVVNVSIKVPKSDETLINKLNISINNETKLLISGPSGTAKTSILRVLKGIWKETNGSIERHIDFDDPKMVLFLPQKPILMPITSLLEQLSYPLKPDTDKYMTNKYFRDQIIHLMTFLDLHQLLQRIGDHFEKQMDWNWIDCLSPGEQQRISFVRLFLHRPLMAVLDESTSAISVQMERKIYEECNRLNIAIISCGHRTSLEEYHSCVLRVQKCDNPINSTLNEYSLQRLR
ncbi:lysosomal cobalamin transporter ABCD4-like [Oppia nitens]|uniref:lysosomal cobalamin transporter ABCD4-like n=1 Tax=Oppia nitens TaxID=1686743 RepID=UPI0023DC125A|nr:lysosomal cobalamin transporter ABCD4-like [Oppia nitens]